MGKVVNNGDIMKDMKYRFRIKITTAGNESIQYRYYTLQEIIEGKFNPKNIHTKYDILSVDICSTCIDIKGKDIYENDIVPEGIIIFHEKNLGFFIKTTNIIEEYIPLYDNLPVEVISNIYKEESK